MAVKVHSRADSSKEWDGVISKIDLESAGDQTNSDSDAYFDSYNAQESATSYTFYVALESSDDILLGQHVYVEPDGDLIEESADNAADEQEQDAELSELEFDDEAKG